MLIYQNMAAPKEKTIKNLNGKWIMVLATTHSKHMINCFY